MTPAEAIDVLHTWAKAHAVGPMSSPIAAASLVVLEELERLDLQRYELQAIIDSQTEQLEAGEPK